MIQGKAEGPKKQKPSKVHGNDESGEQIKVRVHIVVVYTIWFVIVWFLYSYIVMKLLGLLLT